MAEETKVIEIPAPDLRKLSVLIRGLTPLLCNRFGESKLTAIESAQTGTAKGKKPTRVPEDEFNDSMHMIDGGYGFPAPGIKKALVHAGGRFADEKMTHLRGAVNIAGALLPIVGRPPVMRRDPVRLKTGWSIAYRGCFTEWEIEIPFIYMATVISDAQLINLTQIAGFAVGIGSWRPECNGTFGQFEVLDAR